MTDPIQLIQQGLQCLQERDFSAAVKILREAESLAPQNLDAQHFLGLALCQAGFVGEGIEILLKVREKTPTNKYFVNNLANILFELGRQEEAISQFRYLLELDANFQSGWKNLAIIFRAQGRYDEAEHAARKAQQLDPTDASPYNVLGAVFWGRKMSEAARPCFERAVALDPGPAEYHHNLGLVMADLGLLQEAVNHFNDAILRNPGDATYYDNLGHALYELGRSHEGLKNFEQALKIDPKFPNAHNNLGVYYAKQGSYDLARQHFAKALDARPGYPQVAYNQGLVELTCGDFAVGWDLYESRLECAELNVSRIAAGERWLGQSLRGKKIFVFAEQGYGDTVQFMRYLPLLSESGAEVVFECQLPLLPLLQPFLNRVGVRVIGRGEAEPHNSDYFASLLSLPRCFATDLTNIPPVPDISMEGADERVLRWKSRFSVLTGPRVGVCWAGSAIHHNDRNRSIKKDIFAALAKQIPANFVSLCKDESGDNAIWPDLLDVTADFSDFSETAACIQALDLVITVDTSVAHVAATLGKPTWLLVPYVPDWRWLLEREDTPWYPSMRLFRQSEMGEWAAVMGRVNRLLIERFSLEPAVLQ